MGWVFPANRAIYSLRSCDISSRPLGCDIFATQMRYDRLWRSRGTRAFDNRPYGRENTSSPAFAGASPQGEASHPPQADISRALRISLFFGGTKAPPYKGYGFFTSASGGYIARRRRISQAYRLYRAPCAYRGRRNASPTRVVFFSRRAGACSCRKSDRRCRACRTF